MNYLIYFPALFFVVSIRAETSLLVKYRDIVESLDIDTLLKNDRLVSGYMKCLLDKRNCRAEGLLIREAVAEIITTACAECTEKERNNIRKVMNFIYTTRPQDFENIYSQFDPQKRHRTAVMNFMKDDATPVKHHSSPSHRVVHLVNKNKRFI